MDSYLLFISSILLLAAILYTFYKNHNREPIFGLYHRPGRFFIVKYWILRALFWLKPRSKLKIGDLERLQPFSESPQAFDAVFFDGVSQDGNYFIMGSERRPDGIVNGLFYLVTKEEGLLLSEKLPNTELKLSNTQYVEYYGAEGIRIHPVEPMREWVLEYEGKMRSQRNPDQIFDVNFRGSFQSSTESFFSFDSDFSRHAMAHSMAKEPWSRAYFEQLVKAHQNHYEQIGTVEATLELGGDAPPRSIRYQGFRDHSFGFQRDWRLMHRFTFQILFMKDGSSLIMGNVCQPCTCTELVIGYFYKDDSYWSIRSSDFQLYQHGEDGRPPLDYAFTVQLDNGTELIVSIQVQDGGFHFVGHNVDMKVHERFVKCQVNGVEGRGVSECVYNQVGLKRRAE